LVPVEKPSRAEDPSKNDDGKKKSEKETTTRYLARLSRTGGEAPKKRRTKEEKEARRKVKIERISELVRQRDERTREVFGDDAMVVESQSEDQEERDGMEEKPEARQIPRHYDDLRHLLGTRPSRAGLRDWPRRFSAEQQRILFKLVEGITVDYNFLDFDSAVAAEALDKFSFQIDVALQWLVTHGHLPAEKPTDRRVPFILD
jgi:hypothetical protein